MTLHHHYFKHQMTMIVHSEEETEMNVHFFLGKKPGNKTYNYKHVGSSLICTKKCK